MTLFPSTKTKLRDSIHAGHLIYVPSQPFTYQSWTGLVYIDLDPNTGYGGYIIGEGLNGGFTACTLPGQGQKGGNQICEWNQSFVDFLRGIDVIGSVNATIITPTNGQQFTKGDIVHIQITYSTQLFGFIPLSWTETEELDTSSKNVGNLTISSKYGSTTSIQIILNYPIRLGISNNDYDKYILNYSTANIPGPLVKSVIQKESSFNPNAIRYEIHTDYNWYSGRPLSDPPEMGWRGLMNYPEKHWRLGGHNALNESIIEGDEVKNMKKSIYTRMANDASPKFEIHDTNSDNIITAQEIKDLNPRRGWTNLPPNLDYTAQLILASSYGLMQPLYDTARWNGFEDNSEPVRQVEELFTPKYNIQVGVRALNFFYQKASEDNPSWSYEQKIKQALLNYNGGGDPNYPLVVYDTIFLSGIYNQL